MSKPSKSSSLSTMISSLIQHGIWYILLGVAILIISLVAVPSIDESTVLFFVNLAPVVTIIAIVLGCVIFFYRNFFGRELAYCLVAILSGGYIAFFITVLRYFFAR